MRTVRAFFTATWPANGQVLVVGGLGINNTILASAELYGPTTDSWTETGSMRTTRYSHTATLLKTGKVLVAGGYDSSGAQASAELYTP